MYLYIYIVDTNRSMNWGSKLGYAAFKPLDFGVSDFDHTQVEGSKMFSEMALVVEIPKMMIESGIWMDLGISNLGNLQSPQLTPTLLNRK